MARTPRPNVEPDWQAPPNYTYPTVGAAAPVNPPGIGHNEPPADDDPLAEFKAAIKAAFAEVKRKSLDQQLGVEKIAAVTEENVGVVTSFVVQARDIGKLLNSKKDELKKDHLARANAVQMIYRSIGDPLAARLKALSGLYDKFIFAKEKAKKARLAAEIETREAAERTAREEADRKEREAIKAVQEAKTEEDREAAVDKLEESQAATGEADAQAKASLEAAAQLRKGAKLATTQGDYGGTGFIKDNWTFEILKPDEVPREYCSPDPQKLRTVVRKEKRVLRIPGVRVYNDRKSQVRKT